MKMSKYVVLYSAVLLALTTSLKAQETPKSLPITLDKAIEIALTENPTIKIAGMEIQRQEYVRKETIGNLMPNITGSGSYNYNIMNQVMFMPEDMFGPGTGGPMRMGFDHSFTGGVSLALPLFMPTIYKTLQLNEQQMRNAVESARASKVTLVNQVKKNYYAILLGENSLDVIKKNIEYAQVVVNDTRNSFEQGVVSEYDLITAQVQLSNLNPTLIQTENSIRNSRLMLNMLLSLPLDTQLEFEENLYGYKDYINGNPAHIIDLSGNTDLKLLDIQKDMLGKQFEMQRAQRIPNLSAVAQYQVLTQSNDLKVGHYDWKGTALAGLQLSIPIFAGFTNTNKERQLKNNIEQLSMQRNYLEKNVDVQAQTALSNITRAREQMLANEAAMTQAGKGYKIAKTRFETGAGTIVEVNTAQMALLQADLNYSQSIYDYMSAQADFDQVNGQEK